jgi:HEAT repeat protein
MRQEPPAVDRARSVDPAVRRRAVEDLVQKGPAALGEILAVLQGQAASPEEAVRSASSRLGSRSWKERTTAQADLVSLGRRALPHLEPLLASADPEVAWRAQEAADEIRSRETDESRLEDQRAEALCEALGRIGDPAAVPALESALGAGSPAERIEVRVRAAEALAVLRGRLTEAQAASAAERTLAVIEVCVQPGPKARLLRALGAFRVPSALRPLEALAQDRGERNLHLRRSALAGLAAAGTGPALRAVARALESETPYLRQAASALLEEAAGRSFGFDPLAGAEANREALQKVHQWGKSLPGW